MRQAKKIIAISEFTKEEIIKLYQVQAERIVVAYPGLNKFQIPNSKFETNSKFKIQNIKTKYGIKDDYLLYLGTLQPKKNLIHLIEAFYILYTKYKILNTSLVVAGKKGWLYEQVFEKVKELRVESKVVFTDYVPEEDKYRLVAGSQCFILPSLYEGFGIPVLEAMAIGVPVAISNVSSLPEVGGEAAFYFDPEKPQSIAQTIADVLKLSPSERVAVAQKGKTQAEKFTWEKCARTILDTLEQLAISN
jgi:glycosyltransferase involved in cell wall biosynthesis